MTRLTKTLTLTTVLLLIPILPFALIGELPGERWLSASDTNAGLFGFLSASLLAADVLLPVPSSVVITMMGARLDFLFGWILAWAGLTVGNLVGYAVGRSWPARMVPEIAEQPTLVMLFISRPIPVLAEAMAIGAGAVRSALGPTMAACAAGNLFYAGTLAAAGASLLSVDAAGWAIALAVLVPSAGWITWRYVSRRATHAPEDR